MRPLSFAVILAVFAGAPARVAAPGDVEVIAMDYAFKIPNELPAGRTVFRFRNTGKFSHELNIALLKPGVTVQQFMAAANASKPVAAMIDAPLGVLFAKPGKTSSAGLSSDLVAGRTYVARCIFTDSAGAPRHERLGMYSAIRVTAAKSAASTTVPVDTVAGMDYAFRYSRTLAPGPHRFAFTNIGKQRHEFAVVLLKRGVTLDQVAKADAKGEDVEKFFEEDFGLLHAPAGQKPAGLLELDLLPGRDYMIECGFSDTEKSPPHYTLGMVGIIHVTGKVR